MLVLGAFNCRVDLFGNASASKRATHCTDHHARQRADRPGHGGASNRTRNGAAAGTHSGAAGSLVVVLLWVYYSAQIFLLGAEFTWVYAQTFGSMRASGGPGAAGAQAAAGGSLRAGAVASAARLP